MTSPCGPHLHLSYKAILSYQKLAAKKLPSSSVDCSDFGGSENTTSLGVVVHEFFPPDIIQAFKIKFNYATIWGFPKIMVPQNGWFIMETPIKMDDLGVKNLFSETSILPPPKYIDYAFSITPFVTVVGQVLPRTSPAGSWKISSKIRKL